LAIRRRGDLHWRSDIANKVRFTPESGHARLFDHLVGGREQRSWHRKADSLGGFEVDRELVFRRLLKR
jgi:hypothetical protein